MEYEKIFQAIEVHLASYEELCQDREEELDYYKRSYHQMLVYLNNHYDDETCKYDDSLVGVLPFKYILRELERVKQDMRED